MNIWMEEMYRAQSVARGIKFHALSWHLHVFTHPEASWSGFVGFVMEVYHTHMVHH